MERPQARAGPHRGPHGATAARLAALVAMWFGALGCAPQRTPPAEVLAPAEVPAPAQAPAEAPVPAEAFKPFVFILTGDPELGKPDPEGSARRFALLPDRAKAAAAALVVIPGDLTHDDTRDQWKTIEDAVRQFAVPVCLVPGNHDKAKSFAKHVGPDHYVFTLNNCDFVCTNTNVLGSTSGKGKEHLAWLEAALKESRRRGRTHVFVVMHNPIADRDPVRPLLVRYGVKVVLAGHLHRTAEIPGAGFVTYVATGTAKFRDSSGFGYRVFRVDRDRVDQEFVPLEDAVPAAEPKK